MGQGLERTDQGIDEAMGLLLRTGVAIAAAVVFTGGAVYLTRHAMPATDYRVFHSEPEQFRTLSGIASEAFALSGRGLIQFGLLLLIATPIARVVFSVFAFLYQRDWKYIGFTLTVLSLLLYSLLGHR